MPIERYDNLTFQNFLGRIRSYLHLLLPWRFIDSYILELICDLCFVIWCLPT
jgi:hypothetical protein